MADVRIAPNMVLSDGTTLSQLAAVDASGRLSVNLTASSATVTVDTELSAAAALTDNFANPTVPGVGAFSLLWDGATWDRQPGNAAGGAFVQGNVASDVAVTAQPLLSGGRASSAVPTAMSADGDAVALWLDRNGGTVVNGRDAHDAALDALTNPQLIGGRSSAAAPTDVSADGDAVRAWFLRNGAQAIVVTSATGIPIPGEATNGLDVDVTRVQGTVTVDSEMPAAAALADAESAATAVPTVGARLMGYNGTTWDRVRTANTGRLQVDVITGGGVDTPTSPIHSYDTSTAVAAGAVDNHDTADLGGTTKKCTQVIVGASVPMRSELQEIENGALISTLGVFFTQAGETKAFSPPHRNYWSIAFSANAGQDGFRLARTNLDPSEAADVYSEIFYED